MNLQNFENLQVAEQVAEFGKMFNLKLFKKDFEEIKNYNLFSLLTDETLQQSIKNKKLKKLLSNIKQIATIFSYTKVKTSEKISSPADIVEFLKTILKSSNENFIAIFLNANNRIIKYDFISKGTAGRSAVYPEKVARIALLENARSVIIAHNHPSGTLKPSEADIKATDGIRQALKTISVHLLDHIIITDNDYYSFKDNCIL